jgi:ribosome-binding factor A
MEERRSLRVAEAVREELSEIIGFESGDPRFLAVEVTDVHISTDGRYAHVKVAARGTEQEQRASMVALDHAQGFLRHELATRLTLRRVPELHFSIDKTPDVDSRIDFLIKRAKKSRARSEC